MTVMAHSHMHMHDHGGHGTEAQQRKVEVVVGAEDGYLLTGDLNILETRWKVEYRIKPNDREAVIKYYRFFGSDPINKYGQVGENEKASLLIKVLLESVVTKEVAGMKVFDAFREKRKELGERVEERMADELKALDCGLELSEVNAGKITPPSSVNETFRAVTQTNQERSRLLQQARKTRIMELSQAGGPVGDQLGKAISARWVAKHAGDSAALKKQDAIIATLMKSERVGGSIKTELDDARAFKREVVQRALDDATRVQRLTKQPEQMDAYLKLIQLDAIKYVLTNATETILLQPAAGKENELELLVNRHPNVMKAKRARLKHQKGPIR